MGNYCCCVQKDVYGNIQCYKCGDWYKPSYGMKSERTSCRLHTYYYDGEKMVCVDCNLVKSQFYGRNCYHCYCKSN